MEQVLKDFGALLGLANLIVLPRKMVRLQIETLGELELIREDGYLLMRLSRLSISPNKEALLELLSATHFLSLAMKPMQAWFQKPNRMGLGLLFSQQEATPHSLYQGLELLSKEFRKVSP